MMGLLIANIDNLLVGGIYTYTIWKIGVWWGRRGQKAN